MKKIIAICMAALLLLAALPVSLVLADGTVKIVGVDLEAKRINLSIKALLEPEEAPVEEAPAEEAAE